MIKVGFCVAYDWHLLRHSLPLIYEEADLICLSIDKDRISWAGNAYRWDNMEFMHFVKKSDPAGKIRILEQDYHLPKLTPMENEVRQRNLIADFMRPSGWHIQLDTDEYFLNFKSFVKYLSSKDFTRPVNICCPLITLFKRTTQGFLYIDNKGNDQDTIAIATNCPQYKFGRKNGHFNHLTNYCIVHQSWARNEQEIKEKIYNWGHKTDFDLEKYYNFWERLDETNFKNVHSYHPIEPDKWQKLQLAAEPTVTGLIKHFDTSPSIHFSSTFLILHNSIWISRFKTLLRKLKIRK